MRRESAILIVDSAMAVRPRAQGTGGQGITASAVAGGTVSIEVGPNDSSVAIINNSTGDITNVAVSPGKDTQVPIPNVPAGTGLTIKLGRGATARIILVEVIAPSP